MNLIDLVGKDVFQLVVDNLVGTKQYWKEQYNCVLDEFKYYFNTCNLSHTTPRVYSMEIKWKIYFNKYKRNNQGKKFIDLWDEAKKTCDSYYKEMRIQKYKKYHILSKFNKYIK
jgi:hypothetical protein